MKDGPKQPAPPPIWRDPLLWLPVVTIAAAAVLFGLSWREFGPGGSTSPSAAPTATIAPTPEPSDPAALEMLRRMESAMNELTSLETIELLRDDSGNSLTTTLLYAAPDKTYLKLATGAESIAIGNDQWARGPQETLWSHWPRVEPFVFPDFHSYSNEAVDVQFGTEAELDARPVQSITFAFVGSAGRFDFVVYADPDTLLIRRLTMEGPGHHMVIDFVDYAPSVTITPPPPDLIAPTPTALTP